MSLNLNIKILDPTMVCEAPLHCLIRLCIHPLYFHRADTLTARVMDTYKVVRPQAPQHLGIYIMQKVCVNA
jgi:hypothetical protein